MAVKVLNMESRGTHDDDDEDARGKQDVRPGIKMCVTHFQKEDFTKDHMPAFRTPTPSSPTTNLSERFSDAIF